MKPSKIVPVLLAAGSSSHLPLSKALAEFGGRTAIEIALNNCRGLERPIVVLGYQADRLRRAIPNRAEIVENRQWRAGQLSSLLAGLRKIPRDAAFLIYPVDLVLLTPSLIARLVAAFGRRKAHEAIIMPVHRGRDGHPVILTAELRSELRGAQTAREVVYREAGRIKRVQVNTSAIWKDFDTLAVYAQLRRSIA